MKKGKGKNKISTQVRELCRSVFYETTGNKRQAANYLRDFLKELTAVNADDDFAVAALMYLRAAEVALRWGRRR